jgi:hypothetical protein
VLIFDFAVFGVVPADCCFFQSTVINSLREVILCYTIPLAPPNSQLCIHVPHIVQSLPVSKYCSEACFCLKLSVGVLKKRLVYSWLVRLGRTILATFETNACFQLLCRIWFDYQDCNNIS